MEYIREHLRQFKQTKCNNEWFFFGDSYVYDWDSFVNVEYVVRYIEQKLG